MWVLKSKAKNKWSYSFDFDFFSHLFFSYALSYFSLFLIFFLIHFYSLLCIVMSHSTELTFFNWMWLSTKYFKRLLLLLVRVLLCCCEHHKLLCRTWKTNQFYFPSKLDTAPQHNYPFCRIAFDQCLRTPLLRTQTQIVKFIYKNHIIKDFSENFNMKPIKTKLNVSFKYLPWLVIKTQRIS